MDPLSLFTPTEFVKPEPCTIYDLYNDIQFKMTKLFIDTRTEKEYNKQHIRSVCHTSHFNSFPYTFSYT